MFLALSCALAALAGAGLRARTAHAATALVDGEIQALAISGDRVVALHRGQVVVLRTSGQVLGRLVQDRGPDPATAKKRRPSADEVLDLAGIPDDDLEGDLAEEALEDEGAARGDGRRRARAGDSPDDENRRGAGDAARTRLLAASDQRIWIGGADGLSGLATDADTPALPIRIVAIGSRHLALSALAVAPDGVDLAALAGNHLLHSSDAGVSWSLLAVLASRPRAIEISTDGHDVYLLNDDGVAVVAHRRLIPIFEGRAYHLARCGDDLMILGQDGVYAWRSDRGVEQRGERVPARRLVCAAAIPGVVLAVGLDLLTSFDGGRTWNTRADLPAQEIAAVAMTPDQLWVGTESGLFVVPIAVAPSGPSPTSPPNDVAEARMGVLPADAAAPPRRLPSFLAARASPWEGLLPRVSLVGVASATQPGGDRAEVWLLLTFPLGRTRTRGVDALQMTSDLLRRRASAAVELTRLTRAAASDEEAAALLCVVRASLDVEP